MKRIFNHPPGPATGKKYWRSLEEFADTPEFRARLEREFPQGAAELEGNEVTRRGFMQFMGASIALAGLGLTGCRRPELHMVPYSKGVEWQIPGNALHYATSMPRRGGAIPLIATTYNGRPTKLEGNPNVPGFNGSTDVFGQSAVLDLYDPDRSKVVLKAKDRGKDYAEGDLGRFLGRVRDPETRLPEEGRGGLAILAEPSTSPTRARIALEVQKQFPKLLWAEYDPWASQSLHFLRFEKADVIRLARCRFPRRVRRHGADHRRIRRGPPPPGQDAGNDVAALCGRGPVLADRRHGRSSAADAFEQHWRGCDACLAAKLGGRRADSFAAFPIRMSMRGLPKWPTILATPRAVRWSFAAASSRPKCMRWSRRSIKSLAMWGRSPFSRICSPRPRRIGDLAEQISQGTVKTLFVLGGNPAFNAPADLGFDGLLTQVEQVIRLGLHVDETSAASTTHIPAAHFLESWGDSLAYDGTYLSQQPLILPLYGGISELELLAALAGLPKAKGAEYIQETFLNLPKFRS
jgi:MoCo/4Fe-4S cofactor protein with predicted Tat translocation signal